MDKYSTEVVYTPPLDRYSTEVVHPPAMRQFLWGFWTPKIIDATLCVNSYGGLDPQNN